MGEKPLNRILGICACLLALLGLGLSAYSSFHHREVHRTGHSNAFCNLDAKINCDTVALSEYSEFLEVPLGIWGITYFTLMLFFACLLVRRPVYRWLPPYGIGVWVGIGCAALLAAISVFRLHSYCLLCIAIYGVIVLQAFLLWGVHKNFRTEFRAGGTWRLSLVPALLILVALPLSYHKFLHEAHAEPLLTPASAPVTISPLGKEKKDIPISKTAFSGFGEDYRKGPEHAEVVVTEFADFQCPACRTMGDTLQQISEEFGDLVQIVFHNYPLDMSCNPQMKTPLHEFACTLAKLGRCAGQKGSFWAFHDLAFSQQSQLKASEPEKWAKQVGLSPAEIAACLRDESVLGKIREDIRLGDTVGVRGTPSVWINGREYRGSNLAQMRQAIQEAMAARSPIAPPPP